MRRARALLMALSSGVLGCTGVIVEPEGPRLTGAGGLFPGDPSAPPTADPMLALESGARRLSQAELDHTLRELVGDTTAPARRFLNEDLYSPFDNDYTEQSASGALIDSLDALAEDVATRAVATEDGRRALVPCTPAGPGDAVCFAAFVDGFTRRAFRRPLDDAERAAYLGLQAFAVEDVPGVETTFYTAVALVVRAVLQDPEFLYRLEVGVPDGARGVRRLSGAEIATRLAFLLWGAGPDDELLAAGERGELASADGRRDAGRRMLSDPRARAQLRRFHAMWLGYRAIPHAPALVAELEAETAALLHRVIFDERRDYADVFRLRETFVSPALAEHYGVAAGAGARGSWVAYDERRAGLLSHGTVLSAFSKFTDTSPTQRGIFVRTRLLCELIPPPPPTVDADQPPRAPDDSPCKDDRYRAHREVRSCAGCHDRTDAVGFGLEQFDMAGRFRSHDDGHPECAIEGVGRLAETGQEFSGPRELADMLLGSGKLDACFVQHWHEFAIGRELAAAELPVLEELVRGFRDGGRDLLTFIEDYVAAERFARRAEEEEP